MLTGYFLKQKEFKIDIRQIFLAIFAHVSFPFVPKKVYLTFNSWISVDF